MHRAPGRGASRRNRDALAERLERTLQTPGYSACVRELAHFYESIGEFSDAAGEYATLRDNNAAFKALEKAFPGRTGMFVIKVDPQYDNLRSDPRYADLLRRVGLPQ